MTNLVKNLFSKPDLEAIAGAIAEIEKTTSGELRVEIRQKRHRNEKLLTIEQIARREFFHLGMGKTHERNGVLLFLLLEERQFYILADEHIHKKVTPDHWQEIANSMSAKFSQQQFRDGIIEAVRAAGKVLAAHYPHKADDKNELSNDVVVN
ncbi:MAG: TPM domain-containing protein [Ignavibacteriales bacterium]|nr:TPM domain-containing protein [Ignavibacteriales bacterium]